MRPEEKKKQDREKEESLEKDIRELGWQKKEQTDEKKEEESEEQVRKRKRERTERCLWAKIYSLIAS